MIVRYLECTFMLPCGGKEVCSFLSSVFSWKLFGFFFYMASQHLLTPFSFSFIPLKHASS